jgi:stringent starvation protein B
MSRPMENACINAYLIDMWIQVICDMGETPHLVVNVYNTERQINVPMEYVQDGDIRFNVLPTAVANFNIDKERGIVTFNARFNKKPFDVKLPCEAIVGVVSKESSVGSPMPNVLLFYKTQGEVLEEKDERVQEVPNGQEGPNGPAGPNVYGTSDSVYGPKGEAGKKPNHLKVVK